MRFNSNISPQPNFIHCNKMKETNYRKLSPPPSRSAFRFSLSARHDLSPSTPDSSLKSLDITSGDLVYISNNPRVFSPNPSMMERDAVAVVVESNQSPESSASGETTIPGTQVSNSSGNFERTVNFGVNYLNHENPARELPPNQTLISGKTHTQGWNCSNQESTSQTLGESVENEDCIFEEARAMNIDCNSDVMKFSEQYFLRKVLRVELGDDRVGEKLMVFAVHAVMLESGFIGCNPVSKMPVNCFHLPDKLPPSVSFWYTLPKLLNQCNSCSNAIDYVVIKFQKLGNFINVDGCLVNGGYVYKVCLDESRFAPTLDSVWSNCDENGRMDEDVFLQSEKEVVSFWRMVKDGLALPSLIDHFERSSLGIPSCLMCLPIELKLRILESLSGKDLARVECVCPEMRCLASNNDLWKQKVLKVFGDRTSAQGTVNWKEQFVSYWRMSKTREARRPQLLMSPYSAGDSYNTRTC